jgi:hypothetical protein
MRRRRNSSTSERAAFVPEELLDVMLRVGVFAAAPGRQP